MNSKTRKALWKYLQYLPVGLLLGYIVHRYLIGLDHIYWGVIITAGSVISLFVILYNVNEYNAIEGLPDADFLESRHVRVFASTPELRQRFEFILELQFEVYDTPIWTDDKFKVSTRNTVIKVVFEEDETTLTVRKKGLSIYPDRGHNYRILRGIEKALATLPPLIPEE